MREIEVKILNVDASAIRDKLSGWGAQKVFEGNMNAAYFDFPDGRLGREEKVLRLRTKGPNVEMTYKEKLPSKDAKIMRELEVLLNDWEGARGILKGLGFLELGLREKHRVSYAIGRTHFELDTIPNLPTFLEIEAPTLEELRSWVEKLGFGMEDAKPWSWKEVVEHYGGRL